jgi:hypothetical protein
MKIMLVHLRFMTTVPLRFLPPLHINSPPVVLREKDATLCPDSMGLHHLRFSISDFAPADGQVRCSRKGISTVDDLKAYDHPTALNIPG